MIARETLDAAAADPRSPAWQLIWQHCLRPDSLRPGTGSPGTGSPGDAVALLPWLARTCAAFAPRDRVDAVALAGIVALEAGAAARAPYAGDIATLRTLARESLAAGGHCDHAFVQLQKAVLGLDGDRVWSSELGLVVAGEVELRCPACTEELLLCLEPGPTAIEPGLSSGLARRLHAEASEAGLDRVATALTRLFGHVGCPACGHTFAIADVVADQW
jgi:hypothetical protein